VWSKSSTGNWQLGHVGIVSLNLLADRKPLVEELNQESTTGDGKIVRIAWAWLSQSIWEMTSSERLPPIKKNVHAIVSKRCFHLYPF
jgi:hypothetical protein